MEKIAVSDIFVHVYENITVKDVVNTIKNLSLEEQYLLIITCIDSYDLHLEDIVFLNNISPFKNILLAISEYHENNVTSDIILSKLISSTDRYITLPIFNKDKIVQTPTKEEVIKARRKLFLGNIK